MIKALMLIFSPGPTWDRIVAAQRRWPVIFLTETLPLLVIAAAGEGYALVRWGQYRGEIFARKFFPVREAVAFELTQTVLWIGVLFFSAFLMKNLAASFRGGRTFAQAFTAAAYGLSPLFLLRLLDMIPGLWPGVSWAIGIILVATALYHGLPRVMTPELPQAFGFFVSTALLMAFVTALVRFVAIMYLLGKLARVESLFSTVPVVQ
jgi:hypothetical protein